MLQPPPPHTLAAPQWGYEGSAGPDKLARLDVANEACEMGEIQSPFDIPFPNVCASILGAFDFAYNAMPLKVIGNDHIVQVTAELGSAIIVGDSAMS